MSRQNILLSAFQNLLGVFADKKDTPHRFYLSIVRLD